MESVCTVPIYGKKKGRRPISKMAKYIPPHSSSMWLSQSIDALQETHLWTNFQIKYPFGDLVVSSLMVYMLYDLIIDDTLITLLHSQLSTACVVPLFSFCSNTMDMWSGTRRRSRWLNHSLTVDWSLHSYSTIKFSVTEDYSVFQYGLIFVHGELSQLC